MYLIGAVRVDEDIARSAFKSDYDNEDGRGTDEMHFEDLSFARWLLTGLKDDSPSLSVAFIIGKCAWLWISVNEKNPWIIWIAQQRQVHIVTNRFAQVFIYFGSAFVKRKLSLPLIYFNHG